MNKLLIYTALWKRPEITAICFEGIKRLQAYDPERFDITPFCVVSTEEDAALCEYYEFDHCMAPNIPLGRKWNIGLRQALDNLEWDYLVQIGSDDLLHSHLLESYDRIIQDGIPHAGVRDLYFVNPATREAISYTYSRTFYRLIGAGRIFSRTALEASFPLWNDGINKALDFSSENKLISSGYPHHIINTESPRVLDIKSSTNIWSFDRLMRNGQGTKVPFDLALEWVSETERELIEELCTTQHVA